MAAGSSASPRPTSWTTARQAGADLEPVGRRPLLAAGNSNGDIPMLAFAQQPGRPALRLLVLHDDPDREFDYTSGAEEALERARARGWTIVSIKNDWATVFDDAAAASR